MEVTLTAGVRDEVGSGPARRLRVSGRVPGVVYGHGETPLAVSVVARELSAALHTAAGSNVIINLEVDGRRLMDHPVYRDRLLKLQARVMAMEYNGLRLLTASLKGEDPGIARLIVKLMGC